MKRTGGTKGKKPPAPKGVRHQGVPIGTPAQDLSHDRERRDEKRPLRLGPNNRTTRTPKLTRSRAIDRSLRRNPPR